jgi:18S rRNA (guanine1575-N7)-methyltransferase
MITNAAMKNGFTGGLIVDFPNSRKAKKYFLFLMAGYSDEIAADAEKAVMLPTARVDGEGYSDVDSEMSDGDSEGGESGEDEEASSSEEDKKVRRKAEKRVGVASRDKSKTI